MTAQGGDILAFLDSAIRHREYLARLTEDESGAQWREDPFLYGVRDQTNALAIRARENRTTVLAHIAANDPESVLRRCAADRKLAELHQRAGDGTDMAREYPVCRTCTFDACPDPEPLPESWPCPTLLAVAEGYGWTEAQR